MTTLKLQTDKTTLESHLSVSLNMNLSYDPEIPFIDTHLKEIKTYDHTNNYYNVIIIINIIIVKQVHRQMNCKILMNTRQ